MSFEIRCALFGRYYSGKKYEASCARLQLNFQILISVFCVFEEENDSEIAISSSRGLSGGMVVDQRQSQGDFSAIYLHLFHSLYVVNLSLSCIFVLYPK